MVELRIRPELALVEAEKRTFLTPMCCTLSKKKKILVCWGCLKSIKVLTDYSSNISKMVLIKELKLISMKSHDCHVLLIQLFLVAM
jgi:hypothetical protein